MANSLGPPGEVPAGHILHARSESSVTVEPGTKMVHRLVEHGLTAEYGIQYQIGAGILAHSYITAVHGYLYESPVTWFRSSGWDVSPGYAAAPAIDFDRPITETCLFCHAAAAKFSGSDGRKPVSTLLTGITCERCHGASEDHVRHPLASNIVNPRKLPQRARDSICEQCHLEGAVRVLNPGRSWTDFQPGDRFERTAATYVLNQSGREMRAVSQVEQLAQSQCAIQSSGRLWCGSCHQPHGQRESRDTEIRRVCVLCHANISAVAHPTAGTECLSCHMPRVESEYAHVAVTDHRIVRHPLNSVPRNETASIALAPWVEPPVEFRQRDLVLAGLTAGAQPGMNSILQDAFRLLDSVPLRQLEQDAPLLAVSCDAMLGRVDPKAAVARCRQSAEKQPESADRALAVGRALALAGAASEAERQFLEAIRLDPAFKRAYVELWSLYDKQHRTADMRATADRFLKWNPRNILFRRLNAILAAESGADNHR